MLKNWALFLDYNLLLNICLMNKNFAFQHCIFINLERYKVSLSNLSLYLLELNKTIVSIPSELITNAESQRPVVGEGPMGPLGGPPSGRRPREGPGALSTDQ